MSNNEGPTVNVEEANGEAGSGKTLLSSHKQRQLNEDHDQSDLRDSKRVDQDQKD